jgi:hypothetical protein
LNTEDLVAKLLGRRDFYAQKDIIRCVTKSNNYNSNKENLDKAEALNFFHTSKQKTWLILTSERLYCVLDDNRKEIPIIKWSIPKSKLIDNNKISINIKIRAHSEKSYMVDIGPITGWLFSKKLFTEVDIKRSIEKLIETTLHGDLVKDR